MLIVFDDMIAYLKSTKKVKSYSHQIVSKRKETQYFIVFISKSYFRVPKTIRLNATH